MDLDLDFLRLLGVSNYSPTFVTLTPEHGPPSIKLDTEREHDVTRTAWLRPPKNSALPVRFATERALRLGLGPEALPALIEFPMKNAFSSGDSTLATRSEGQIPRSGEFAHPSLAPRKHRRQRHQPLPPHVPRRLPPRMIDQLWPFLRYWDPAFLAAEPTVRPEIVSVIVHEPANAREWVEAVDTSPCVLAGQLPDGRRVLAERSELSIPAWERLQEVRESRIMSAGSDIDTDSQFFQLVTNQTALTYAHEEEELDPSRLVIKNFPRGQNSPSSDWIALNPSVGRALGWKPDVAGLFRWMDSGGALMAETLWWVDGPVETVPPENDMVGEGCLVVVSAEALEAVRRTYGTLVRSGRITRSGNDDGHPISRVRSSTIPL